MRLPGLSTVGGLANALGLGLEGYSQDVETRLKRERQRLADVQQAKTLGQAAELHTLQTGALTRAAKQQDAEDVANRLAYDKLPAGHPARAYGYDPGTKYTSLGVEFGKQQGTEQSMYTALQQYAGQPGVDKILATGFNPQQTGGYKPALEVAQKIAADAADLKRVERQAELARPKSIWANNPATGQDEYVTEEQARTGRYTKPLTAAGAGGGGGSRTLSPEAVQGMYEDAADAANLMKQLEWKWSGGGKSGASLSPISTGLGATASQKAGGFWGGLMKNVAGSALAVSDPDYQRYLNAQRRFGNIMSNLQTRRYTEQQSTLDTDLSGIGGSEALPTLQQKWAIRENLLGTRPGAPKGYKAKPYVPWAPAGSTVTPGAGPTVGGTSALQSMQQADTAAAADPQLAEDRALWDQIFTTEANRNESWMIAKGYGRRP